MRRYLFPLLLVGVAACHDPVEPTRDAPAPMALTGVVIGTETVISDDAFAKTDPRISGDLVVWTDSRNAAGGDNTDIYLYDLAAGLERQVTTDPGAQFDPDVSGSVVVWTDKRAGNEDIFLYDLAAMLERQVTTNPAVQRQPAVSGNWIVWTDRRNGVSLGEDIYKYDLVSGQETPVTNDAVFQYYPSLSGDIAVWQDFDNRCAPGRSPCGNYDSDIWYADLVTGTVARLFSHPAGQGSPDISGRRVAFVDSRYQGNGTIFIYDMDTMVEQRVSENEVQPYAPRVSGDRIVWQDGGTVYLHDLATGTTTPIATGTLWGPDISGNRIVYSAHRNGTPAGIYMFEITAVIVPDVAYIDARIDAMVTEGSIANQGVGEALHALLSSVAGHVEVGNLDAAVRGLEAFTRLVTAHAGRGISTDAAAELIELAGLLIEQYQGT